MNNTIAVIVDSKDNVATVFSNGIEAGSTLNVMNKNGDSFEITVQSEVPYGHKIAVSEIGPNEKIIKYGECIGISTGAIHPGEYVHVHNMMALRGRGDL